MLILLQNIYLYLTKNKQTMDFLNIKSPNFLGGTNVHNALKVALVGFIVYKVWKK